MYKILMITTLLISTVFAQNLTFNYNDSPDALIHNGHVIKCPSNFIYDSYGGVEYSIDRPYDFSSTVTVIIDLDNSPLDLNFSNGEMTINDWAIDMNDDGIWEQPFTSSRYAEISFDYPTPPQQEGATYNIRFKGKYYNYLGEYDGITEDLIPIRIWPIPKVYSNQNDDHFLSPKYNFSSSNTPVLLVEGFDPLNQNYLNYYYHLAYDLIQNELYTRDYEAFLLNFSDGGTDMRDNADVLMSALYKIHQLIPNHPIKLIGLSMGGVISRYALARAEEEGVEHHVGTFVSYDSPQAGANLNYQLQTYISAVNQEDFGNISDLQALLQSEAAKQLLIQNAYDILEPPDNHGEEFNDFYADLNSRNGNGYPHTSYNVAVSNGAFDPAYAVSQFDQPLFSVDLDLWHIGSNLSQVYPSVNDVGPGSLYSLSLNTYTEFDVFGYALGAAQVDIHYDPAFIPTWSSLDLQNWILDEEYHLTYESTPFDYIIEQTGSHYHPEITNHTINELLSIFDAGTVNINIVNKYNNQNIDNSVPNNTFTIVGSEDIIQSGEDIHLPNNTDQTIITNLIDNEDLGIKHHDWNENRTHNLLKHQIFIEHGINQLRANYDDVKIVSVVSSIGNGVCQISDPWWVIDEENRLQSDEYHTTDGASYPVFLNQGGTNPDSLQPPYYSLRAPLLVEDGADVWQVFHQWSGNGFELGNGTTVNDPEVDVVFTDEGASITAEYHTLNTIGLADLNETGLVHVFIDDNDQILVRAPLNAFDGNHSFTKITITPSSDVILTPVNSPLQGYSLNRLSINGDGSITYNTTAVLENEANPVHITDDFPQIIPGTTIEIPSGVEVYLHNGAKLSGSAEAPITLQSAGTEKWEGIFVQNSDKISNLVIKEARTAFSFPEGYNNSSSSSLDYRNITISDCYVGYNMNAVYGINWNGVKFDNNIVGIWGTEDNPSENTSYPLTTEIRDCIFNSTVIPIAYLNRDRNGLKISNNTFTNYFGYAIYLDGYSSHNDYDAISISENVFETDNNISAITAIGRGPIKIHHNLINISNTGGTGITLSNELTSGHGYNGGLYSEMEIQNGYFPPDWSDYGIDLDMLYNLPNYPYNDPPQYYSGDYAILNNTIVGGYRGMFLDLETSATTWHSKIQNNILLNPNNDPENPDYLGEEQLYCSGSGIVYPYDNVNNTTVDEIGYNIFFGQDGQGSEFEAYLVDDGSWNCERLAPYLTDFYETDPLLTSNYHLTLNSPALDAGNNVLGNDGDGTTPDIGAFYFPQPSPITSSITIATDGEWYGLYRIDGGVTVSPGATLTIQPGSVIKFTEPEEKSSRLLVDGDLIAVGLPGAPITFTSGESGPAMGDWVGLVLGSSVNNSITIIDNCIIEYAGNGIELNGASPDITNNIIQHNTRGIYVSRGSNPNITTNEISYNAYGVYNALSSPVYTDNLIENNTSRGMYFYGTSTPHLFNNTVQNNSGLGVYMYNHVDAQFGNSVQDDPGFNEIINNSSYGIYASYYCDPFLGTTSPYNTSVAGYNSIHDNSGYNLRAYNNSIAEAEWNWWDGETSWSAAINSSYDTSPTLGSAPNPSSLGSSLAKTAEYDGYADCPDYDFFNPDTNSECALWHWSHDLRITDQTPIALWTWKLFVRKYPASENAPLALIKVANFTPSGEIDALTNYLYSVLNTDNYSNLLRIKALELLVGVNMKNGDYSDAYTCALDLLDQSLVTDQERIALFSLIDLSQYILGKTTAAQGYLKKMKTEYPNDELTLMAAEMMGEDVDWSKAQVEEESKEKPSVIIPDQYQLYPAFPNPFNPSTTMRYDLPEDAAVELSVFDITGRKVISLIDNQQNAGQYHVTWQGQDANGRSLPSGLYIYLLRTSAFSASEKVMFIK